MLKPTVEKVQEIREVTRIERIGMQINQFCMGAQMSYYLSLIKADW